MTDFFQTAFGAAARGFLQRIHTYEDIRAGAVALSKPSLEVGVSDSFGTGDALQGLTAVSVTQQNGDVVRGLEERQDVFAGTEWLRRETRFDGHAASTFACECRPEVEGVGVGIVVLDFENFGDEAPARSTFDVHHDIDANRRFCS